MMDTGQGSATNSYTPKETKLRMTEERFGPYRKPTEQKAIKYEGIQQATLALALLIEDFCPDSQQKSTALTQLEMCKMSANASIAIHE